MRIAVITWGRRRAGGVETYLAQVIPALTESGHSVAFWYEMDRPTDRDPIVTSNRITEGHLDGPAAVDSLRSWQPDVLYLHGMEDADLEARVLEVAPAVFFAHGYYGTCISGAKTWKFPAPRPCSRRFGLPCLLHFYPHRCGGLNPLTMVKDYRRQSARLSSLRRYAAIVTHSQRMRDEYTHHDFPQERVHAVPFPVVGEQKARHTITTSAVRRLAFIGRMDLLKGGEFLIRALPEIQRTLGVDIETTFVGDGPERTSWEEFGRSVSGSRISIRFTGWQDRTAINALLDHTDLLLVPSLWPEPFGQVGIEAALRGVPAAGFATGGIPDWLEDGVNGFLAPGDPPTVAGLARAVIRSLENPRTHADLREGAEKVAKRYTMERHLAALVPILSQASR